MVQPSKGLEQKVIISQITDYQDWSNGSLRIPIHNDPEAAKFGDYSMRNVGTSGNQSVSNTDSLGQLHQPSHYQDKVHPYIFNKDSGTGGRTGSSTRDLEFELDVESITHSWNNQASQMDLWAGGTAGSDTYSDNVTGEIIYQLNAYALDLGVFAEILAIRGTLIDQAQPPHQASAGRPHIRRQQLLDIARGQWAPIRGIDGADGTGARSDTMNPNKWLALTIGPVRDRSRMDTDGNYTEDYWTAGEPHAGDIRGKERLRNANLNISGGALTAINDDSAHKRALTYNADYHPYFMAPLYDGTGMGDDDRGEQRTEDGTDWNVLRDWDYKLSYDGRTRYRGMISSLSLSTRGGRPDVWDYNFQFVILKNEMMDRTSAT